MNCEALSDIALILKGAALGGGFGVCFIIGLWLKERLAMRTPVGGYNPKPLCDAVDRLMKRP